MDRRPTTGRNPGKTAQRDSSEDGPVGDEPTVPGGRHDRGRAAPTLTVPDCRILRKLGEGGMGEVYEAEQTGPVRRRVALKVIKWGMDTKEVVARFESERQALALLNHPSIAKVFEAGATQEGRPYFAMELVAGAPITDYCDRHRLSTQERLELFLPVCEAVQHAHMKGIIHRDLKPSNVLVSVQDGAPLPKVIDFGIAKATSQRLTERTVFTEHGQMIGTPAYMSPEQAEMTGLDVDTRTDVYSLGVLLYVLLTGALPFSSEELGRAGLAEIQRVIREDDPPRPSTRVSQMGDASDVAAGCQRTDPPTLARRLKGDLDWIVMCALEKDRTRRYETANALALDLRRHLDDEAVLAGPPSLTYRAGKFARRHRIWVVAGAMITLAVLAGLALATTGMIRAQRAERIAAGERDKAEAVSRFLRETLASADPYMGAGRETTVAEALDAAAETIDASFPDQPEIRAAVRHTMGETYYDLGRFEESEALLRAALEDWTRLLGPDHADVARAQNDLGVLLVDTGDHAESETLLRAALASRQRIFGSNSLEAAESAGNLAMLLEQRDEYADAETLLREVLAVKRSRIEGPDRSAAKTLNNLGLVLKGQGELEEAQTVLEEALEERRTALGAEHPEVAESLSNLAGVIADRGDEARAEALYRESLEIMRTTLGEDHPRVSVAMNNLAGRLRRRGDLDGAGELYARALDIMLSAGGEDNPGIGSVLNNMANLELSRGNFDRAQEIHREALAFRQRLFGENHLAVAISLHGLAAALHRGGDQDEAVPYYERAVAIYAEHVGADDWRTARTQGDYGRCLAEMRRYGEAEEQLRAAEATLRLKLGDAHPRTKLNTQRLVELYEIMGEPDRAEEYRSRLPQDPDTE
jgi:tetratricopeptide (TPR) repeat protein